jgi:transcriptional regulator with XRE-family HTH domain
MLPQRNKPPSLPSAMRIFRISKGYTLEQVSHLCGISVYVLHQIELRKRRLRFDEFRRLTKLLKLDARQAALLESNMEVVRK